MVVCGSFVSRRFGFVAPLVSPPCSWTLMAKRLCHRVPLRGRFRLFRGPVMLSLCSSRPHVAVKEGEGKALWANPWICLVPFPLGAFSAHLSWAWAEFQPPRKPNFFGLFVFPSLIVAARVLSRSPPSPAFFSPLQRPPGTGALSAVARFAIRLFSLVFLVGFCSSPSTDSHSSTGTWSHFFE